MTGESHAMLIAVLIMVAFNGLFLSLNGLFMLVAPQVWYEFVPGVTDTGFLQPALHPRYRDHSAIPRPRFRHRNVPT
jgi:hypothetical protein